MKTGGYHPLVKMIGKLTPEHIDKLATHLAKTNAPLPNMAALNPALHALQVQQAMKAGPEVVPSGDGMNTIPKPPAPMAPPTPEVKPAGASMTQEGQAQGLVSGNPVRSRNPYMAFKGA